MQFQGEFLGRNTAIKDPKQFSSFCSAIYQDVFRWFLSILKDVCHRTRHQWMTHVEEERMGK